MFQVECKKGRENSVAVAFSGRAATGQTSPTWLDELQQDYQCDPDLNKLITPLNKDIPIDIISNCRI